MARADPWKRAWPGVVAIAVVAVLACATSAPAAPAEGTSSGERLYRSHCGACHRLRDPSERTAPEWAAAVEKYGPRAHLEPQDRPAVIEYLSQHAR